MTYPTILPRSARVLEEVSHERARQDAKWGEQNHPNGTGLDRWLVFEDAAKLRRHAITAGDLEKWARSRCERLGTYGVCTYEAILTEEWAEALAQDDPQKLRAELIQVAAVAVAWVEKIDRDGDLT